MIRSKLYGYYFVLPALIYMLLLVGYPIIDNIRLSFYDVNVLNISAKSQPFIGLQNYSEIFNKGTVQIAMGNTLFYTVLCIIFQFIIGFALALFFNQKFGLSGRLRGLVMISWLMPGTITALMFKFMFSLDGGIINSLLLRLHLIHSPIEWLIQPHSAMWAAIIANTWIGVPFNMILLTTGLITIPKDIYESAAMDGANAINKFLRITLPLLKPAITSLLILGFIYTFKVFDLIVVMTNGGPVNATEMLSTYSYKLSFGEFNFSQGAAVANILFVILFIISLGYLKMVSKEEVM
jgi:multiple sugar transport system permease protein